MATRLMQKTISRMWQEIKNDLFANPPPEWTMKRRWQHERSFGVSYVATAAFVAGVLAGVEIWVLVTEQRLGFSSHWIPWLLAHFGWLASGTILFMIAARISHRNGHPGAATACTLMSAILLAVAVLVPDRLLIRIAFETTGRSALLAFIGLTVALGVFINLVVLLVIEWRIFRELVEATSHRRGNETLDVANTSGRLESGADE